MTQSILRISNKIYWINLFMAHPCYKGGWKRTIELILPPTIFFCIVST